MRIAPIDVAHKTFSKKLMGCDADEVAHFLRDVADQLEEVVRERNALKEQMRERDLAIVEYKQRDETLKNTITTATKMSDQIRQDAEREGKLILHDAEQKAEMIVKDARDSLKRIYQEISDAKRIRMQFDISMRSLIQAHLAMLDQGTMVAPDPTLPSSQSVQPNSANQAASAPTPSGLGLAVPQTFVNQANHAQPPANYGLPSSRQQVHQAQAVQPNANPPQIPQQAPNFANSTQANSQQASPQPNNSGQGQFVHRPMGHRP